MEKNIFVSTRGDDKAAGTQENPIRSFEEAQKRVRTLRDNQNDNIRVSFRQGEYFFNKTIILSLEDGGNNGFSITYEAYPGEEVIFTSGVSITGWSPVKTLPEGCPPEAKGKLWKACIPKKVDSVLTLFAGDDKLIRSISPEFSPSKDIKYRQVDSLNIDYDEDRDLLRRVDFPEGTLKNWSNLSDIELRFRPVPWTMNLIALESVDEEAGLAWLEKEATAPMTAKNDGIQIENAPEYISEGRWFSNSIEGLIYYWPQDNQEPEDIITPSLQEFIRVEGEINSDELRDTPIKNIHFKNLSFKYGKTMRVDKDYKGSGIQHDWEMHDKATAMLRFRGAENCSVRGCSFTSTSGTALRLDLHCQHITIENNFFDNIGIMGILLCGYGPGLKDVNKCNIIRNNILTRCGKEFWHGHCIFLWQSGENLIENNKIHHSARKAIGLCGVRVTILRHPAHSFDEASKTIRWQEVLDNLNPQLGDDKKYLPFLHCRNNKVQHNDVSHVLEKIADGAAINVSGAGEGNHIFENYIHHLPTYMSSGAIRVDDWQRGTTIESNIVYKSNKCGMTRKNYNHLINNYIIDVNCRSGYLRFASYPGETAAYDSLLERNIFFESGDSALFYQGGYLVSPEASLPKHCQTGKNLFYVAQSPTKGQEHLDSFKEDKVDITSQVGDPLFTSIEEEDFSLAENSPAFALGIKPINQSAIGLTEDYPSRLLEKEYRPIDNDKYDRGTNEEVESYEWW